MIFRLENVGRQVGGEWLFRSVSGQCNVEDRIGLIGRNGSGKTTLFRMLEGRIQPDEGTVHQSAGLAFACIEQVAGLDSKRTVRDEALSVFQRLQADENRLQELEHEMTLLEAAVPSQVAEEYEHLRFRLRLYGGYDYPARTEAALLGLGFSLPMLDRPCGHLSGGQASRLQLARALLQPADLLLLDEPTNHLDLQGILWITGYLRRTSTPFAVISHDRQFLDAVTNRTWEIEGGRLHDYPASFSRSRQLRQQQLEQQERLYAEQQEWRRQTEDFIRRNIAGQKTRQAQSRRRQLEKTEWLEAPRFNRTSMRLSIPEAQRGGQLAFEFRQGTIGYPLRPLIENVSLRLNRGDRVGILGGNGSGKSTLLKSAIGQVPLLSGELKWGPNNVPAYFAQNPEDLLTPSQYGDSRSGAAGELAGRDIRPFSIKEDATIYDFFRELDSRATDHELRSLAARFLFREEEIFKPVRHLSGGERSRLALARLFFHPSNVLLLDEPTNHLDIPAREALEEALSHYSGGMVIVSHDLYFLKRVVRRFYLIRQRRLVEWEDLDNIRFDEFLSEGRERESIPVPETTGAAPKTLSKNERQRFRRRLTDLERRIQEWEQRQQDLQQSIQSSAGDFQRLKDLSEAYSANQDQLEYLYQQWEEVTAALAEGDS